MVLKDLENILVAEYPHLKRSVIKTALKVIFEEMKVALEQGIPVKLHRFGTFFRHTKQLPGMTWISPERHAQGTVTVKYWPAKGLEKRINDGPV